jgi:hypothetical protein
LFIWQPNVTTWTPGVDGRASSAAEALERKRVRVMAGIGGDSMPDGVRDGTGTTAEPGVDPGSACR